jgi:hypothetical protein
MKAKGYWTMLNLRHKLKYINWKEEAKKNYNLTIDEFDQLLNIFKMHGHKITEPNSKTIRSKWTAMSYATTRCGNYCTLYCYTIERGYEIYTTNSFDDQKNNGEFRTVGSNSIRIFNEKFKEITQTTLLRAYGSAPEEFKICIPKQFYYLNDQYKDKVFIGSEVDKCAHFPSSSLGKLPTYKGAIKVAGIVEPTEEYPFAFYLESGHVAIYNELNTRTWLDEPLDIQAQLFNLKLHHPHKKDGSTILMKASDVKLDDVWKFFYEKRHENESYKIVMNATIGYFHTKAYNRHKLAHLAAVIIARANQYMIDLIHKIGYQYIAQVVVDSITYKGGHIYGVEDKALGLLHQEYNRKVIKIKALGSYMVMDGDKVVKVRHGGYNVYENGEKITMENTTSFLDMNHWKATKTIDI